MTARSARSVSGYVLIGGASRRLGIDKAAYLIDGEPAAIRMARLVQPLCDAGVFLVGRMEAPWSSFTVLADVHAGQGPLGGVSTALEHAVGDVALILATDLWSLTMTSVERILREVAGPESDPEVDVACGVGAGRAQPLCSAWRVQSSLGVVRRRIASGQVSMFGTLEELRTTLVEVGDEELANVNEPRDLEMFLRQRP